MPFTFTNGPRGATTLSYRYPLGTTVLFSIGFLWLGLIWTPAYFFRSISVHRDAAGSVSLELAKHPLQKPETFTGIRNAFVETERQRTSDGTDVYEYLMLSTEAGAQRAHALINRPGEQEKRAQRINALIANPSGGESITFASERVLFADILLPVLTALIGVASLTMAFAYHSWTFRPQDGVVAIRERGFLYARRLQKDLAMLDGFDATRGAAAKTAFARRSGPRNSKSVSFDTRLVITFTDGSTRQMPQAPEPRVQEALRKMSKIRAHWPVANSPLDTFVTQKLCGICGLSCEQDERVQDENGTYYHRTCYEQQRL